MGHQRGCHPRNSAPSIATDARGNSYVSGSFRGTTTFGAGQDNETVLNSAGDEDVFVAKYAPNGTLLWAKSAGGSQSDAETGIATNARGNSYVIGSSKGTATFGAGEHCETVLSEAGGFVAKYAPDGTLLWAKRVGGSSIATDNRDNSYVTGSGVSVAKYSPKGTLLWAKTKSGFGGSGIAIDANGNSYVAGSGVSLAKYSPKGALLWAKRVVGEEGIDWEGIATDTRGNSYVTGIFSGTVTFGEGEDNETVLNIPDNYEWFVAKYAPDGTFLWVTSALGFSHSIATGGGNSYVTGTFRGTATFGAGEDNETVLGPTEHPADWDIFVAKYGSDSKGRDAVARR